MVITVVVAAVITVVVAGDYCGDSHQKCEIVHGAAHGGMHGFSVVHTADGAVQMLVDSHLEVRDVQPVTRARRRS